jgi:hypothetical protein
MAAASSTAAPVRKGNPGAAALLAGVSIVALLYLYFMFQLYNDPGLRQLGFNEQRDISTYSFMVFALLFVVMLVVRIRASHSAVAAEASPGTAAKAGAAVGGAVLPSAGHTRPRVSAEDPASRPGAPPSTSVPNVPAEDLKGGWKRYRFPAERTGGLYVDTDIVVDGGAVFSDSDEARRGRMILRVRDEVARVCVRCDLIDHCHGRVAGLISLEEMRANFDCIPGLKRIANVKVDTIKRTKESAAKAAQPAPNPAPDTGIRQPPDEAPAADPVEAATTPPPGPDST